MNSRFLIMLVIALILAGVAAMIAKHWVESQPGKAEQNMIQVYVAATDIPFASRIENTQLKLMALPKNNVPPQAFTEEDIKKDPNAIVGKVAQRDFFSGEIFLKSQLKEHPVGSTLSALIEEGKRAISVRVDDVAGVAGFILPGNKADIIVSGAGSKIVCQPKAPGYRIMPFPSGSPNETYTLLPNIKILAIDQTASQDQDKPAVVRALTLEVDPTQAECLVQAMRTGALQFTLRNPTDIINTPLEVPEASKVNPPIQIKPAPLLLKILPWGSEKLIECEYGTC
jgi:pilus assembly protein CpaB